MSDDRPAEPIARDLLSDGSAALTLRLDAFAGGIADRLEGFGIARGLGASPLLDALTARWTLPEKMNGGLELFDLDAFDAWSADWSTRAGYEDMLYEAPDAGFVIPLDPDASPLGFDARSARREGRDVREGRAFRPVISPARRAETRAAAMTGISGRVTRTPLAPTASAAEARRLRDGNTGDDRALPGLPGGEPLSVVSGASSAAGSAITGSDRAGTFATLPGREPPTPGIARAHAARERWRAADGGRLTAYPAAMGRAGALEASMLRFPEARARIGGDRPAIIGAPPGFDLTPDTAGLAPAARSAERRVQALVDRLVPTAPSAIAGWLVPAGSAAGARALPDSSARPGRWQSIGLGSAFAVPAAAAPVASIGIGERLAAAADAVVARVDGAPPSVGEPPTYAVEPAGVLVEPTAERAPDVTGRAATPTARRESGRAAPTPAAARATSPAASTASPALAARSPVTASSTATSPLGAGLPGGIVSPRADATPLGAASTRAALRDLASSRAVDVDGRAPLGAATRADSPAARAGTSAGLAAPFASFNPTGRAGLGLARGIAERFARATDRAEPQLAAHAMLLEAILGPARRPIATDTNRELGSAQSSPAQSSPAPIGPVSIGSAPIGSAAQSPASRPEFLAGRSAAAFLLGAVGPAIGRFADRLAVGVGGEPGTAAAWPVGPAGELVAPASDATQSDGGAAVSRASTRAADRALTATRTPIAASSERAAPGRQVGTQTPSGAASLVATLPGVAATPGAIATRAAARSSAVDALQAALAAGPTAVGDVGRAATALAGRVGARLEALVGGGESARPMSGIVERLASVLGAGPRPALLDALRRFEATDDAAEGARAWSRISTLADLGPSAPALVQPMLDAITAGSEAARVTTARSARAASERPAVNERPAETRAAIEVLARRMGRLAAIGSTAIESTPRWAAVLQSVTGASPGRSGAPSLAGWVLDPTGRSWIRPATAVRPVEPSTARTATTAAPIGAERSQSGAVAPAVLGAAGRPEIGAVRGSIGEGGARVEALASRIAAAVEPTAPVRGATPFAFAGEAATTLLRADAAPGEAAVGRATERSRPSSSTRAATESTALVAVAREVARALGRPGAVGSASERLAAVVAGRPAALRSPRAAVASAPGFRSSVSTGFADTPTSREMVAGGVSPTGGGAVGGGAASGTASGAAASARPAGGAAGRLIDVDGLGAASRSTSAGPGTSPAAATIAGRRFASLMDTAALVESDALTASEARLPARIAGWWRAASAPMAEGSEAEVAFADAAFARVVVAPFGGSGDAGGDRAERGDFAARGGRGSTANAALVAFERARASVRGGARAAAVGRIDTPADLGELFQPPTPSSVGEPLAGRLFGDRGPQAVTAPGRPRVLVETGSRAAGDQPLRSAAGETPGRNAEKNEESRHRLAEQMEGDLSPEEIDEIAEEVIGILRREVEFDMARLGEDEWD